MSIQVQVLLCEYSSSNIYCHWGGTSAYNSIGVSIQVQVLLCEYSPSNIYCHRGGTSAYNSIGVSKQVQVLPCEYSSSNIVIGVILVLTIPLVCLYKCKCYCVSIPPVTLSLGWYYCLQFYWCVYTSASATV